MDILPEGCALIFSGTSGSPNEQAEGTETIYSHR